MEKTKHTPGPWQYERWYGPEDTNDEQLQAEHIHEGLADCRAKNPIIRITSKHGETIISCHDLATIEEANARLIAAAPELLEALQEMVAWWEKDGGSMDECIERSKSAIARATGQSSTSEAA